VKHTIILCEFTVLWLFKMHTQKVIWNHFIADKCSPLLLRLLLLWSIIIFTLLFKLKCDFKRYENFFVLLFHLMCFTSLIFQLYEQSFSLSQSNCCCMQIYIHHWSRIGNIATVKRIPNEISSISIFST
jgi:hypothetical protein